MKFLYEINYSLNPVAMTKTASKLDKRDKEHRVWLDAAVSPIRVFCWRSGFEQGKLMVFIGKKEDYDKETVSKFIINFATMQINELKTLDKLKAIQRGITVFIEFLDSTDDP